MSGGGGATEVRVRDRGQGRGGAWWVARARAELTAHVKGSFTCFAFVLLYPFYLFIYVWCWLEFLVQSLSLLLMVVKEEDKFDQVMKRIEMGWLPLRLAGLWLLYSK